MKTLASKYSADLEYFETLRKYYLLNRDKISSNLRELLLSRMETILINAFRLSLPSKHKYIYTSKDRLDKTIPLIQRLLPNTACSVVDECASTLSSSLKLYSQIRNKCSSFYACDKHLYLKKVKIGDFCSAFFTTDNELVQYKLLDNLHTAISTHPFVQKMVRGLMGINDRLSILESHSIKKFSPEAELLSCEENFLIREDDIMSSSLPKSSFHLVRVFNIYQHLDKSDTVKSLSNLGTLLVNSGYLLAGATYFGDFEYIIYRKVSKFLNVLIRMTRQRGTGFVQSLPNRVYSATVNTSVVSI